MKEPCRCITSPPIYIGMTCDGGLACLWLQFQERLRTDPILAMSYPVEAMHAKATIIDFPPTELDQQIGGGGL